MDTMHARSVAIFDAKKAALARGDADVARQVGEGRDIMSILRGYRPCAPVLVPRR